MLKISKFLGILFLLKILSREFFPEYETKLFSNKTLLLPE